MSIEQQIADCVATFYEDALSSGGFEESHKRLISILNSTAALTFTPFDFDGAQSLFEPFGIPATSFDDYSNYYHKRDVWMPMVLDKGFASGTVVVAERYIPSKDVLSSEFYNDFLKKLDIANVCCSIIADDVSTELPRTHCSVYRPDFKRPFSPYETELFHILSEKLRSAIVLRHRVGAAIENSRTSLDLLHGIAWGIIILNASSKVVFVNAAAEAFLSASTWLDIERGKIKISFERENRRVRDTVDRLLSRRPYDRSSSAETIIVRSTHQKPTILELQLVPASMDDREMPNGKYVAIFINAPREQSSKELRLLRELFGLTSAESRLALGLAGGMSLNEYAARRNVTINTARTQLKRVFGKTSTHRQAELVDLINRVAFRY